MLTSEHNITFNGSVIHYVKSGQGKAVLLLFHGFGQDHTVFEKVTEVYRYRYTIYAFDLFFHGKSTWNHGERPLEKEHWNACMRKFFDDNSISRFSLGAYSLGARFAFTILEGFPCSVDHIFLIAPDAIKTNIWYNLATYPVPLRRMFKIIITNPRPFYVVHSFLQKLMLMNKGLLRFAESQMNTESKRKKVYYSWVVFRHLTFTNAGLAELVKKQGIRITMILGEFDNVIALKNMGGLLKLLPDPNVIIVKTGHAGLLPAVASEKLFGPDNTD